MIETLLRWLCREKFEIGRSGNVYLTRWTLLGKRFETERGKVFLHRFHRSDSDGALHNHPWAFWSLIIWGGYYEWTETGRRWKWPGSLLFRPPEWRHRVELHNGRRAWTIVWAGKKVQSWGFFCAKGFTPWKQFVEREDAGQPGCE